MDKWVVWGLLSFCSMVGMAKCSAVCPNRVAVSGNNCVLK